MWQGYRWEGQITLFLHFFSPNGTLLYRLKPNLVPYYYYYYYMYYFKCACVHACTKLHFCTFFSPNQTYYYEFFMCVHTCMPVHSHPCMGACTCACVYTSMCDAYIQAILLLLLFNSTFSCVHLYILIV